MWRAVVMVGCLVLGAKAAQAEDVEPPAPKPVSTQTIALSVHGGYDLPTRQPLVGIDLAFHHDGLEAFRFLGRVQVNLAIGDLRPHGKVEAGFAGIVGRQEGRAMRLGLLAGTSVYVANDPTIDTLGPALPLQLGSGDADFGRVGFLPYGQLVLEFGWRPAQHKVLTAWTVGFRAGASAALAYVPCDDDAADGCLTIGATFVGGLEARLRFQNGLHLEFIAGPTAMAAIGYAF